MEKQQPTANELLYKAGFDKYGNPLKKRSWRQQSFENKVLISIPCGGQKR